MSQMYQKKSFKSSGGGQSSLKYGGGAILCLLNADLPKTIFVPKIQINWANIGQVITLCANWHSWGLKS